MLNFFNLEIFPYFKLSLSWGKVKVIMKVVIFGKYMMKNEDIVSGDLEYLSRKSKREGLL